ncbi:lytic transglycosylase domain-containing protein [Comamonas sp.]|uniref:lytic transglycosylase domain-containing protein n=1 Tax=Comamonas sp. TaxID=34028 RepID=UPI00289DE203|nr:lytic transglycosylase domain-containing protein [Comamonas sp.]
MAAGGWGYALAAAINGGLRGMEMAKGWERQAEDDAFRKEERAQKRQDWNDVAAERQALKEAAQPVAVQQYTAGQQAVDAAGGADAGPPQIDMEQLPANPAETVGWKAGKQSFADQAAAQKAADSMNTPVAMMERTRDAYLKVGKPDKAMAVSTQLLQQQEADQRQSDRQWRNDLGRAMQTGHEGLAKLVSASSIGPMSGMTVKPMDNGDGTVSYVAVGKDGTTTAIPGIPPFKNDQDGVTQAAFMLDRTITPEHRYSAMMQDRQHKQAQSNADRMYNLQVSQDLRAGRAEERAERAQGRQDRLADMQLEEAGIRVEGLKSDAKIPSAVKLQVQTAQDELKTLNSAIVKAQAEGTFQPDSPQGKELLDRRKTLSNEIRTALFPYSTKDKSGGDPAGWRTSGAEKGSSPNSYKDAAWDGHEAEAAKAAGIPADVLRTVRVNGERSNGDQVSPKGAKGVYQFIPATRDAVLKKYGYDAYSSDPKEQTMAAAMLLKEINGRNGGDWGKTFAGYNGGISGEKGTNPTTENREYVQRTMSGLGAIAANRMVPMYGQTLEAPPGTAARAAQQASAAPASVASAQASDPNNFYNASRTKQRNEERKAREEAEEKEKAVQKAVAEAQEAQKKAEQEARRQAEHQRVAGNALSMWQR